VLERLNLPQVAQPYLALLAETTQETVNVVVLDGGECMNISGAASPRPIQYIGRIGRRTPLHCTAAGKVLLAYLPAERQRKLLPAVLPRFTAETIVVGEALEQALIQVRERGYARSDEEHQEGVSAVAAPIYDHTGQVVAALTISGPTYRMNLDEVETFIIPVRNAAEAISTHLGYIKPSI
jgi:IclR family acetate operon transcriptional repressor